MQQIIDFVLSDLIMVITPIIFGKLTLENKLRKDKSKFVVAFLISCILYGLLYLYLDGAVKTLCVFCLHIFMFYYFYNIDVKKSLLITFIYSICLVIPDLIQMFLFTNYMYISIENYINIFSGSFISNMLVCFFTLVLSKRLSRLLKKICESGIEIHFSIVFFIICMTVCVISLFNEIIFNYRYNLNFYKYIFFFIIFVVMLYNVAKGKIDINNKIKEYNTLLRFMKNYENELEEKRIKGHEIKNQISTINSMLMDNANKHKLEKYVKELVGDYKDLDNVKYSDLQYLPSNGIKGFICSKISLAVSKNIDVEVLIEKEIEHSVISNLDDKNFKYLCIILGVLLDNAIEASIESIDKKMGIEIYLINRDVLIVITNSFINKNNDRVNLLKSSKGKNRGHGLKLVRRVISQSNKFVLTSEVNLDSFVQKLLINGEQKN